MEVTKVTEIEVRYKRSRNLFGKVQDENEVAEFIRKIMRDRGYLQYKEAFISLFVDRRNNIHAYAINGVGEVAGVVSNHREIATLALLTNSSGVIISHNHPSGNPAPSEADRMITSKIRSGLAFLDITLLDSLIITADGHTSIIN